MLEALIFGFAVVFMILGLIGIVIPILPGLLLIWLTTLAYALVEGFEAIDAFTFIAITIIALLAGTADIWMSLLGAKTGGASFRAMALGLVGGIIGFIIGSPIPIVGNLIGGIVGYAFGVLIGQFHKYRDWNSAFKASVGGIVGWGIATVTQVIAGVVIILIFAWQVLSYSG